MREEDRQTKAAARRSGFMMRLTPAQRQELERKFRTQARTIVLGIARQAAAYYAPGEALELIESEVEYLRAAAEGRASMHDRRTKGPREIHIIMKEPPSPTSQFVEVETRRGRSLQIGEWHERGDGLWALVIKASDLA